MKNYTSLSLSQLLGFLIVVVFPSTYSPLRLMLNRFNNYLISSAFPCKGLSIYYVIRDGGAGVFPNYYNIT